METPRFAVCINNSGYDASLEVGKLYQILPDVDAEAGGFVRVIDEDGEDYLYGAEMFCTLPVPPIVARTILETNKQG